ncbi:MAG: succinylglutamate desuccinylase/aspartoacylase family protein [Cyanobacteriota bacterium]|nr:succinylglutamate desuccinylase/aspartoacylase family protein [Cyanobacteriota bacterium]
MGEEQNQGNGDENRIAIAGETIEPGQRQRLEIPIARLPTQTMLSLPVAVVNGLHPGPKLWLSAAIHGDEINGVEIIRQVLQQVDPQHLQGTLIAVPIVNLFGFIEQSRYLPDRRDLNRCFPGSPTGSLASRLAHLFMQEIVLKSTHGIDLHTAAAPRANLPQIRANTDDEETYRCALAFSAPATIRATTRDGSLRQAAAQRKIPVLLYEAGEILRFDREAIRIGVEGILRVMAHLNMHEFLNLSIPEPTLEIKESKWIRASRSGILHAEVALGEKVSEKQLLATITDAFGEQTTYIRAKFTGLVIGCVQNPLVSQGDGIFHVAVV